jgi:RNA exonuclease 4
MPLIAVDVECVATGIRHDARSVCSVALVAEDERVILYKKVKPSEPIVSYLTPITGMRAGDLNDAESLERVLCEVHALLGPDVSIVGQAVQNDINWLRLKKGKHYKDVKDVSEVFAAWHPRYHNLWHFSLQHEANTLLGAGIVSGFHDPAKDALYALRLYKKYCVESPHLLERAKRQLMDTRPAPSIAKRYNYSYEGVCMAAYYPAKCFCGAPTKS